MILNDIKVPADYTEEDLLRAVRKAAGRKVRVRKTEILRRSIDARKKPDLFYVMKIAVNEDGPDPSFPAPVIPEEARAGIRAAVIGSGPAGLFSAITLQESGIQTVLIERGDGVEKRKEATELFFRTGKLDPESNVQFGEGGAGTFSDGKLNTGIRDREGYLRRILESFVRAGAPEDILYDAKPHIGTDVLLSVVRNLRERFIRAGGEVLFRTKCTGFRRDPSGRISGVLLEKTADGEKSSFFLPADYTVLAIGHSARDTFEMLYRSGVPMEKKAFAVGFRIEHPQAMINEAQYGRRDPGSFGAAPYKLTFRSASGRGVYSFCMCPGGRVVNASSEPGLLAVNGMSMRARDGKNANSGIVVQVHPEDFPGDSPLQGMYFQRELERKAYLSGGGKIPVQLYRDFRDGRASTALGEIEPDMTGAYALSDLSGIFPAFVREAVLEALPAFGKIIRGFDREDAVLSAVESRTSSPVRILRNASCESEIPGLYPCGEGAGYAGGIMSAAADGIRVSGMILKEISERYG